MTESGLRVFVVQQGQTKQWLESIIFSENGKKKIVSQSVTSSNKYKQQYTTQRYSVYYYRGLKKPIIMPLTHVLYIQ